MQKEYIVVANLIWEYNDLVINKPINMGELEQMTESQEFEIKIKHDSNKEITGCAFYIDKYSDDYFGSLSPLRDYERVLWLANNYPGFGLSLHQEYEVTGQLDGHDGTRLIDFEREERTDIFSGSVIEILSGLAIGETAVIESYNPSNQILMTKTDFSTSVKGASYKIAISKETLIKAGQGADYTTRIPLVYKGGVIERLDEAVVTLKMRIPKFAQSEGRFLFDFNMQFTSLEEQ